MWETWSRERLGVKDKDSETAAFWTEFIASLKARGWSGIKLVINIEPETSQISHSDLLGMNEGHLHLTDDKRVIPLFTP